MLGSANKGYQMLTGYKSDNIVDSSSVSDALDECYRKEWVDG